jgi:hypothetical protein
MAKRKIAVPSDIYTAILALALMAVLAAAIFVTFKCGSQYGWSSLFEVVKAKP